MALFTKEHILSSLPRAEMKSELQFQGKHKSIVAVMRVVIPSEIEVSELLRLSDAQIPDHSNIVIKINLSSLRTLETGATTDPRVLKALVNVLRDQYCANNITVVESNSTAHDASLLFHLLGFKHLSEELNFRFMNLSDDTYIKKQIDGYSFKEVCVPSVIANADYFISLAKLKTHELTGISCTLKNQFGCYPYARKIEYHNFLINAIIDANIAMRPDLALIDGVISMIGSGGPTFGLPFRANILIGSKDPVAADAVCARILGLDPIKLDLIRKAVAKKIGTTDYSIRLSGLSALPSLPTEANLEKFIRKSLRTLLRFRVLRIPSYLVSLLSRSESEP
jgi:uncharacterized protein (DUF362 family)